MDYETRQKRLLTSTDADAVAIIPGANMTYYTGLHFHLSERPTIALFTRNQHGIIIPTLEIPVIQQRADLQWQIFPWSDADGFAGAFEQAIHTLGISSIAVDGQTMRVFEYLALKQGGAKTLIDIGKDLLHLRALKTEDEIQAMREAIQLSQAALDDLLQLIKPGMTERQIADELNRLVKAHGSEGFAFEALVQTGPNSGIPHGAVSDRVLQANELLLIDFGGKKHGYPADITRTFCIGEPTDEMRRIYDVVLAANQAAIAAVKPGVPASMIDKAARDVIQNAGYGEYFIHRTGHGLGLEVHEMPQISSSNDAPLEIGMVFTIEPGIYLPHLGGVRIEDNVVVRADGAEVLTSYSYGLTI
ncbi:MAG: aminopeptidase P family protein [Phototrophicales bacterium]|nr:MAG: aminopeptidase P family protein [Phototrophicales bacterium]RMG78005.1 MAG: aminopeptidase P family protein [Chloroflexota bacterium]